VTDASPETFAIRPALAALILLAVPLSPGIVLGVLTWLHRDGELAGSFLFAGALAIWLSVATLRVELSNGILSMRRFGLTLWKVEAVHARLRDGSGGDVPVLPAVVVSDARTTKRIGSILKAQFRPRDLEALRRLVAGG